MKNVLHRPERKMRQTHSKIRWLEVLPSVKSTDGLTFSISSFLFENGERRHTKFTWSLLFINPTFCILNCAL